MSKRTEILFTATLASGEVLSFTRTGMPKHWKSWIMQQAPYGTDFCDAIFARKAI